MTATFRVDRPIEHADAGAGATGFGPWNPGIESQVPDTLQHLCTIFRAENAATRIEKARELRDLTGLPLAELATFHPRRLALHELLIRVTADFFVPEGPRTEDLGINFRKIVSRIQSDYVEPEMARIDAVAAEVRGRIGAVIAAELAAPEPAANRRDESASKSIFAALLTRLSGRPATPAEDPPAAGTERQRVDEWVRKALATDDPLQQAALNALARVANAMLVRHERIWGGGGSPCVDCDGPRME